MKRFIFYLLIMLSASFYSCEDMVFSLAGTKWQSADKSMIFEFVTDSTCKMMWYTEPNYYSYSHSAYGVYHYEKPNITILSPYSNGFGSYEGTITGAKMKIKPKDSNFDFIEFSKIK